MPHHLNCIIKNHKMIREEVPHIIEENIIYNKDYGDKTYRVV